MGLCSGGYMWTIKLSEEACIELDPWLDGFGCWRRDASGREAVTGHLQVTLDWLQQDPQLSTWLATAPEACVQAARHFHPGHHGYCRWRRALLPVGSC